MNQRVHLPNTLKILTSGGYPDAEIAKSTSRDMGILGTNHEEADIHLILYGMVVASTGFSGLEVICQYTDVFPMLIHFLRGTRFLSSYLVQLLTIFSGFIRLQGVIRHPVVVWARKRHERYFWIIIFSVMESVGRNHQFLFLFCPKTP